MSARDVIATALRTEAKGGAEWHEADCVIPALRAAGYAVVPVEPSREMVKAAINRASEPDLRENMLFYGGIWRAMIAAAKENPDV